jgi:hypothetical protein
MRTVLYFEHAARELPLDLLLGAAIGGGVAFACPPRAGEGGMVRTAWLATLTLLVIGIVLAGTLAGGGLSLLADNLLQYHSRPGVPLVWGAHWRYHLGSRLALILASIGLAGVLRYLWHDRCGQYGYDGLLIVATVIALYAGLSVVFAQRAGAVLLAFQHPISLGHQAREILTHGLITLPLSWGLALLLVRDAGRGSTMGRRRQGSAGPGVWVACVAGVVGVVLGGYLGVAAWLAGAASHGQSADLAVLLFPHVFEHAFTYLVTPLTACLVYQLLAARKSASPHGLEP